MQQIQQIGKVIDHVSSAVAKDIADVDNSAIEISDNSKQVQVNAEELSRIAAKIQEMVSRFKLQG
ncbi:MAG: hypothetical protein ACYDBT_04590 [Desulfobulbaceae bacterium]